ncbi:MAG: FAD-binding oxidoreductase [Pseudomonas marincola]
MQNQKTIKYDVAVVGAGMVGISCALWLQKSGKNVCLLDRGAPGESTASGSACTFANYACIPINSPSLPLQAPGMILRKNSPLSIKWRTIHQMIPWLAQFLANCRPSKVTHIIDSLSVLLSHAEEGLMPLIEDADARDLIQRRGCLYLYNTEKGYEAAQSDIFARRERGVSLQEVSPHEIHDLEPSLQPIFHKGVLFDEAFQFLFPGKLIERLVENFVANGGTVIRGDVKSIDPVGSDEVRLRYGDNDLLASKVVVATGAHSKALLPTLSSQMPLDTERGYHLMLDAKNTSLNRPVGWAEKGFYMTPLEQQIRISGTVELGGLDAEYTQNLLTYLEQTARQALPDLGPMESRWLGFRPSMPDALPVIGQSPSSRNIILAFGHQHVGLTLGGITGKIVASIVQGEEIPFDILPYSPQRFS